MPISPYIAGLRAHVGHDLLMLPGVSAVVRGARGQILLGRRSDDGSWGLPAGAIDPGEQPADAVVREIYEETGVVVEIERIGGVALHHSVYPNGVVCEYLNVWFRCRVVSGEPRVNDAESTEVGWFDPRSLPELDALSRLQIETTLAVDAPAWFAEPGARVPALERP
ncbi:MULTISPECIES: NUDIX hydrolase [Catenuloplanes]|uniref:8-oxo-dGTP diphosphatase n=1 Tax=Catenuloplanes niger TaxID=587534 RepID=A0AAE3ZKZ9_9ACTN|nr:NUDIX domain-containing protein [Catenuloplanes niger]MDR7320589.1 8-oxo-dGTP diphosphatase [Catenuloplanes niger]